MYKLLLPRQDMICKHGSHPYRVNGGCSLPPCSQFGSSFPFPLPGSECQGIRRLWAGCAGQDGATPGVRVHLHHHPAHARHPAPHLRGEPAADLLPPRDFQAGRRRHSRRDHTSSGPGKTLPLHTSIHLFLIYWYKYLYVFDQTDVELLVRA